MSAKPEVPRQFDDAFAQRVQQELSRPSPYSDTERVISAVRCAALSPLAEPEVHRHLQSRVIELLTPLVPAEELDGISKDLSLARSLCYDEDLAKLTHLTVTEAARRHAVSRFTIYRWLGNSDYSLAPRVGDNSRLNPDRIEMGTFLAMTRNVVRRSEREQLVNYLERDLREFRTRQRVRFEAALRSEEGPVTFVEVTRLAEANGLFLSRSTIRRWPSIGYVATQRGHSRKIFSPDVAAERLAGLSYRQRQHDLPSRNLQQLRRMTREVPGSEGFLQEVAREYGRRSSTS